MNVPASATPASPPRFTKARRNRTFALGVAAGATLMLLLNLAIGATADGSRPQATATTTLTVTAAPGNGAQPQPTASSTGLGIDLARRIDGDPTAMGRVDAPVAIVAYADYRCPFCSLFDQQTLPVIVSEYVETGQVRYEFRDMPLFGQQSFDAAVAGRAAGNQGKFWEFMSAIAANGVVEGGHPDLPRERLIGFAEQAGVPDIARFTTDLDDPVLLAAVKKDLTEGQQIGFSGVPGFLIGVTPVLGAQPIDVFRQVIESELDKAGVIR